MIEESIQLGSSPYSIFILSIRSPITREKYLQRIGYFFDYIGIGKQSKIEERCNIFGENAKGDINWLANNILKYLQVHKDRVERKEITGSTLRNYIKPIKLFCEQMDINIPWNKITRGLPKGRKYANDRAPTIEEIRKMLEYPDRRIRPIIYTMASSGIRLGAWDYLRWRDISPIIKDGKIIAAKITVYADEDEEYFSFITNEAYEALNDWMDYRKQCGEMINENSWIMRNLWDVTTPKGKGIVTVPKKLKSTGVKRLIERALWAQGLRKLASGKRRHEFQADHGFRKWFKTRCEIAGMKSINIETLMDHSIGIADSYYRATEDELLQDYVKASGHLTFAVEHKLQKQVEELTEKTNDSDYMIKAKMQEKDEEIRSMKEQMESMHQAQKEIMALLKEPAKLLEILKEN